MRNLTENNSHEKIEAIKLTREWCENVFGVKPGLKETKDFIEHLMAKQCNDAAMLQSLPVLSPFQLFLLLGKKDSD